MVPVLSQSEARNTVLLAQGLATQNPFGHGKAGALRTLEHLSYVQIDTISVVARAHHHIFRSRVADYQPSMLHEIQAMDRTVFEYWAHAASYLPMKDFRFSLPRKKAHAEGKKHWFKQNKKIMRWVLDRIRAEGPLQARDFEAPAGHRSSGWFDWKPAKIALEQLFMSGELMIPERRGFQKVYDLTERVLPPGTDTRFPTPSEVARHWIESTLRSQGLATEAEMRYLRRGHRRELLDTIQELMEAGEVLSVRMDGDPKTALYANAKTLDSSTASPPAASGELVHILSPFDPLVIQRKRMIRFFDFDYQIECYTPEAKRKFGYFCLPVLKGDRFVGRLDAKADRARGIFEVRAFHLENPKERKTLLKDPAWIQALQDFATFNGCSEVKFGKVARISSSISS